MIRDPGDGEHAVDEPTAAPDDADGESLVESLRRAIDRRDARIARLDESLEQETQSNRALRRELASLEARLAGLEQTLERRTETCERLRQLLRAARGGDLDAVAAGLDDAAAADGDESEPAVVARTATWPPAAGTASATAGGDDPAVDDAARSLDDAIESVLAQSAEPDYDSVREAPRAEPAGEAADFLETVADVPGEMLPPEVMFTKADAGAEAGDAPSAACAHAAEGPDDAPAPHGRPAAALVSLNDDPPRRFPIVTDALTVGRSRLADVVVDSRLVSRLHARLRVEDGAAEIEDLGSTNGIEVNGERVDRAALADGDEIRIGRAHFRFEIEGE